MNNPMALYAAITQQPLNPRSDRDGSVVRRRRRRAAKPNASRSFL